MKNLKSSPQALGKVDLDYFIQQSLEDAPQNSDMDTEVNDFPKRLRLLECPFEGLYRAPDGDCSL